MTANLLYVIFLNYLEFSSLVSREVASPPKALEEEGKEKEDESEL